MKTNRSGKVFLALLLWATLVGEAVATLMRSLGIERIGMPLLVGAGVAGSIAFLCGQGISLANDRDGLRR